jgi:hypothetical protein
VVDSPDIEIVVCDCPPARLAVWLSAVAGPLGTATDAGGAAVYRTRLGPVVVQPGVGGPGSTSIWFSATDLPWPSSAACARLASRALGCAVVCDPGADYPDVDPRSPVLLEVSAAGERLFVEA